MNTASSALFLSLTLLALIFVESSTARVSRVNTTNAQNIAENLAWKPVGHAETVVGMASINGKLWAATQNGRLWVREPAEEDRNWKDVGEAETVVAMTAGDSVLWCATRNGKLWWREAAEERRPWNEAGEAETVVGMAFADGKLWCATQNGKLWVRDPARHRVPWIDTGHAENIAAMTELGGHFFAADRAGKLWIRDVGRGNLPWKHIGHAETVVGMTGLDGKLWCATQNNKLWVLAPFRGTFLGIDWSNIKLPSLDIRGWNMWAGPDNKPYNTCEASGDQQTVEGAMLNVQNDVLFYRPCDSQGCTNHLAQIEASKEVCRVKLRSTRLLGQDRDVYRIVFRP